jgi:hypothetical protein
VARACVGRGGIAHAGVGVGLWRRADVGVGPTWSSAAGSSDGRRRSGGWASEHWAVGWGGAAYSGVRVGPGLWRRVSAGVRLGWSGGAGSSDRQWRPGGRVGGHWAAGL